jgi:lipopolysaccharide export system ATP-binding protein
MIEPKRCGNTLIVRGLQKSYGKKLVVRDVSLQVECGEVVGLLGPNGAGKTTSFYMIVGLVPSDAGSIDISGVDISSMWTSPACRSTAAPRSACPTCRRKHRCSAS